MMNLEKKLETDVSVQDFDKICRLCLKKNPLKFFLELTEGENIIITEFLNQTLQLGDFTMQTNFPQNICFLCEEEIIKIHQYKKQCIENQHLLKDVWEKNEMLWKPTIKEELYDNDFGLSPDDSVDKINIKSFDQELKMFDNFEFKSPRTTCSVCKKDMLRKNLNQHMRTHSKEKPFQCDVCLLDFTTATNMRRHQMIHSGEKPYVCQHCDKAFLRKYYLKKHMAVHYSIGIKKDVEQSTTQFTFSCHLCPRVFKKEKGYNNHLLKHNPNGIVHEEPKEDDIEPLFECDICGKKFKTKRQLKQHISFHGAKNFLCYICGKNFVTRKGLESHFKVHTGEKPYTCTVCGKSFAQLSSFDTHVFIHSGDRPYSCTICPKKFTQPQHLTIHMKIHSGEKPYTCSYCGKAFALKGNLTVHIRRHTGENPYKCNICNKGFNDSSNLNKHKRSHELKHLFDVRRK